MESKRLSPDTKNFENQQEKLRRFRQIIEDPRRGDVISDELLGMTTYVVARGNQKVRLWQTTRGDHGMVEWTIDKFKREYGRREGCVKSAIRGQNVNGFFNGPEVQNWEKEN